MGIYSPETTKGAYTDLPSLSNDASDLSLLSHHWHDLFWERGRLAVGHGGQDGGVRAEMTQDAETALSRICLILHRCMQRKSWINFQSGKERHFPLKLLAIEGIWVQVFNLRIKARPCHYDLWNTGMLGNDAEAVNRCLEAICERWLINGG